MNVYLLLRIVLLFFFVLLLFLERLPFLLVVLEPPFNIPRALRISRTRCFTASGLIATAPDFISAAIASSI